MNIFTHTLGVQETLGIHVYILTGIIVLEKYKYMKCTLQKHIYSLTLYR